MLEPNAEKDLGVLNVVSKFGKTDCSCQHGRKVITMSSTNMMNLSREKLIVLQTWHGREDAVSGAKITCFRSNLTKFLRDEGNIRVRERRALFRSG